MNKLTPTQVSFWQILGEKKIEIPIIQRDYAQGREESPEDEKYDIKEIRESFLDYLFSHLTDDKAADIKLDFIYGNEIEGMEGNGDSVYQLLDGQQRLTTLFLLHWYAANKENLLNNDNSAILKRFTYETRTSSREFCENLVTYGIDFKNLNPIDKTTDSPDNNPISETIKDSFWFFKVWEKDPTIAAMLTMLDAIHVKAVNINGIWKKLTGDNRITFLNFPLKDFGLSDDLYIKMNARGKLLTDFENFKAELQKRIKEQRWEDGINPRESFLTKLDTSWTDLFWIYRNKENKIDSALLQVIAFSMLGKIALQSGLKETKKVQKIFNDPGHVIEHISKEDMDYLKVVLDTYHKDDNHAAPVNITLWGHLDVDDETLPNLFVTLVKAHPPTYKQLVLYYAQTEYLMKFGLENPEMFDDWMRVIRNIVINQDIDDATPYISALQLVTELLNGTDNSIYSFLAVSPNLKSRFAADQMKEEIFKAKIIMKSDRNKKAIFKTGDTNFCQGRLGFIFYCIDCENSIDDFKADRLLEIQKVIEDNLNNDDVSNDFRRALLTIGDNNYYGYWWSWLYAADSPKRCLIANTDDLRKNIAYSRDNTYRDYLKDLLNQLTKKNLMDIIRDYIPPESMPHWKKRLIKEEGLLDYSGKHYIAIPEDNSCCWLIPGNKVAANDDGFERLKEIR
jgi:hypothetical protein